MRITLNEQKNRITNYMNYIDHMEDDLIEFQSERIKLITGTQIGGSVYTGFAATLAQASMKIGISLVLNGVASLLAPTPPKPKERPEDIPSYGFDGPANTTRQGVPIPVCYGQLIVGGAVISSGIEPEDYEP